MNATFPLEGKTLTYHDILYVFELGMCGVSDNTEKPTPHIPNKNSSVVNYKLED